MKHLLQAAAAAAIAFGGLASAVDAKEMKMGLITPPPHIWTKEAQAFGDALKAAIGGKHSVVVYPSRQLGNEAEVLQQMQSGAVDMALFARDWAGCPLADAERGASPAAPAHTAWEPLPPAGGDALLPDALLDWVAHAVDISLLEAWRLSSGRTRAPAPRVASCCSDRPRRW